MNKSKRLYTSLLCHLFIFLFSGSVYYGIEVIFKKSHIPNFSVLLIMANSCAL